MNCVAQQWTWRSAALRSSKSDKSRWLFVGSMRERQDMTFHTSEESNVSSQRALPAARASEVRELRPRTSTLAEDAAARRLVQALIARGVDTFFGVPGGPICPFFEALRLEPAVRLVESRHESHAAFAAAGYYRVSGKVPGVVVTSGPGITNTMTGIASAYLEQVPMLVVMGDVAWANHGGRLAQDSGPEGIDAERLLAPITCAQIRVSRARSAVTQGLASLSAASNPLRPGPALLVLPIDEAMRSAAAVQVEPVAREVLATPPEAQLYDVALGLRGARRPLLVLGGGTRRDARAMARLVDALNVPFVTTPRAKGVVSERHRLSLRNGGMAASGWARAYTREPVDVALVLGSDLDDSSVGPTPYISESGRLVHVDLDCAVFNRNVPTALGIVADVGGFADHLQALVLDRGLAHPSGHSLADELRRTNPFDVAHHEKDDSLPIAPHRVVAELENALRPRPRFITDIGEHMLFVLHYLTATGPEDFHIQLNLGSMGSGIAGAIGLALAEPERPVVCICGDGGMQMAGMEVLTAIQHQLPIVYAVFNDARYNMVHHGMRQIFGESAAYATSRIDFAGWARSLGVSTASICEPGEITGFLRHTWNQRGPCVLDISIDAELRLRGGGRVEALQHMSLLARAATRSETP